MANQRRPTWNELGHTERRTIVALGAVQVGLQGAALRDLRRPPVRDVRGPRSLWAALSFINFTVGRRRPARSPRSAPWTSGSKA